MIAPLPEAGTPDYEILWEVLPGSFHPPRIRELRQIVVRKPDGQTIPIAIEDEIQQPEDLQRLLARLELSDVRLDRLIADEAEREWLERITYPLRQAAEQASPTWSRPPSGTTVPGATIEFCYDEPYWRAIAKIAFHYALKQFPHFTGAEEGFAGIRRFIHQGGDWRPFVRSLGPGSLADDPRGRVRISRFVHLLVADKSGGRLRIRLQFFLSPRFDSPIFEVSAGNHDLRIIHEDRRGHAYIYYYPDPPRGGHIGEIVELHSLRAW